MDLGRTSVPDGLWAFWHPSGRRAARGWFRGAGDFGARNAAQVDRPPRPTRSRKRTPSVPLVPTP